MNYFTLKFLSILLATCIPFTVNARVFKCVTNGKTSYQQAPCPNSETAEMNLTVDRPTNNQIYEAQERLKNIYRENEYKQRMIDERHERRALHHLEVQKANAATKQADATHDDSVAHRKSTAIKLRNLELQSGKIRTLSERDAIRKKWDDKIETIK